MTALAGIPSAARAERGSAVKKPAVPQAHRVPAHLARRFQQICLGVTAEILEQEGLTPIEYGVLAAVDDHPGQDQRGIAARLGIDAASTSQIADRLEKSGLIARQVNPEDRRARELRVTTIGGKLRRRLRPALLAAQRRIMAPLSPDERATFLDLLSRIIDGNESYARPGNGRRKPGIKNRSENDAVSNERIGGRPRVKPRPARGGRDALWARG